MEIDMTEKTTPKKPATPTPKAPRQRRRKVRMEDHPDVKAWCDNFIARTEDEQGFTPTADQAVQAFLVTALKAIGGGNV
jgi:hypothetical protein